MKVESIIFKEAGKITRKESKFLREQVKVYLGLKSNSRKELKKSFFNEFFYNDVDFDFKYENVMKFVKKIAPKSFENKKPIERQLMFSSFDDAVYRKSVVGEFFSKLIGR